MDIDGSEVKLQPYSFKLSSSQLDEMRRIAIGRQLSIADVVREAIREYLASQAIAAA